MSSPRPCPAWDQRRMSPERVWRWGENTTDPRPDAQVQCFFPFQAHLRYYHRMFRVATKSSCASHLSIFKKMKMKYAEQMSSALILVHGTDRSVSRGRDWEREKMERSFTVYVICLQNNSFLYWLGFAEDLLAFVLGLFSVLGFGLTGHGPAFQQKFEKYCFWPDINTSSSKQPNLWKNTTRSFNHNNDLILAGLGLGLGHDRGGHDYNASSPTSLSKTLTVINYPNVHQFRAWGVLDIL